MNFLTMITIARANLSVENLIKIARFHEKVELLPDTEKRINSCRAVLEKKIVAKEIMYGVNTCFGEFSEVVLNDDQVKDFQKYLIYNHAADQEDFVLMGMNTALKNFKTLDNALDILDYWH